MIITRNFKISRLFSSSINSINIKRILILFNLTNYCKLHNINVYLLRAWLRIIWRIECVPITRAALHPQTLYRHPLLQQQEQQEQQQEEEGHLLQHLYFLGDVRALPEIGK